MPKISKIKKDKISEHILHYLFEVSPDSRFTSDISNNIARDEEFTKNLLIELESKKLIIKVSKNKNGIDYIQRIRWRLSPGVYDIYKKAQNNKGQNITSSSSSFINIQ